MEWRVDKRSAGLPVVELLQRRLPKAGAGYLKQLLRKGKCLCNGAALGPGDTLTAGDLLQLPNSRKLLEVAAQAPPLVICFENEELLIVDKPPGLAVHRTQEDEVTLADLVQQFANRQGLPCSLAPVTRIDRGTSGLVTFAKGRKAASKYGVQIMARSWRKLYLALVRGQLPVQGVLHQQVSSHGKLREATARYSCLHNAAGWSLVVVELETGRTHQIRQQFAGLGHPLAGDRRYGGASPFAAEWPFLHCLRLQIPLEQGLLDISSPLPEQRQEILRQLWARPSGDKAIGL